MGQQTVAYYKTENGVIDLNVIICSCTAQHNQDHVYIVSPSLC